MNEILNAAWNFSSLWALLFTRKNLFFPIRCSDYLCFVLNSEDMSIFLSGAKKEKIKLLCSEILKTESPTIRTVAKLLGKFTSSFPTV